jgi:hypothetical protein
MTKTSHMHMEFVILLRTKLTCSALDTVLTVLDIMRWLFLLKKQFPFIFLN